MVIDTMEIVEDHVHISLETAPRLSPARIIQILRSIAGRETFARCPQLPTELWRGDLWCDGYFARAVGDEQQKTSSVATSITINTTRT